MQRENGQYSTMVTNAGAGRSWCQDLDVTRWREDRTRDHWGQFFYIKDLRKGKVWSAGYQPTRQEPDDYEVTFSTDKVEIRRVDGHVETRMEITVSPENQAEVRRVLLTNHGPKSQYLEVTSYAEVALAAHNADLAHPAFQKLFLETEFIAAEDALLCRRRPRSPEQKPVWAVHVLATDGEMVGDLQFETDRAVFWVAAEAPLIPRRSTMMARAGPAEWHAGGGSRSGLLLAPTGADSPRIIRQPGLHDRTGRKPRTGPGAGRSIPRHAQRHPRLRAGLGSQPGGAAPSPHHARRCSSVPAVGGSCLLCRAHFPRAGRHPLGQSLRSVRPVAARHLR